MAIGVARLDPGRIRGSMRRVAQIVVTSCGNVTLVESVRRNMEVLVPCPCGCGCTTTDPGDRNVLLRVLRFNEHYDEVSAGVRAVEGIAIEPEFIVDETIHFEGAHG